MILSTFGKATSRLATLGEKVSPSHPALKTIQMQERIRYVHQTPMFSSGCSVAHAILVQAQMRFTVLINSFNGPALQIQGDHALRTAIDAIRHRHDRRVDPLRRYP